MGYYLQIDTDEAEPLASNSGWGDVIEWARKLPVGDSITIKHLCQFGWQNNVNLLKIQVPFCLTNHAPSSPQTKSTVENLSALLYAHTGKIEIVTVTDGLSESE